MTEQQPQADILDDEEWTVESFLADCDRITGNPPPAPEGMELVECSATPRHWPIYLPLVEGQYPAGCLLCERDELCEQISRMQCERDHRSWKSWRIWWSISSWLYVLGVTSTGGGVSFGRCAFCGVTRQHRAPRWRGRRTYILGKRREWWECLSRGHRHLPTGYGLCSVCWPCPSCGSPDPEHVGDCGGAR